jgi:hypothetical protein
VAVQFPKKIFRLFKKKLHFRILFDLQVVAAVDVGTTATLDLSSRHHEIRSG